MRFMGKKGVEKGLAIEPLAMDGLARVTELALGKAVFRTPALLIVTVASIPAMERVAEVRLFPDGMTLAGPAMPYIISGPNALRPSGRAPGPIQDGLGIALPEMEAPPMALIGSAWWKGGKEREEEKADDGGKEEEKGDASNPKKAAGTAEGADDGTEGGVEDLTPEGAPIVTVPGAPIAVLPNASELIGRPRAIADAVLSARRVVGPSCLLYAPAVGEPGHIALLSYLGIDLFDTLPLWHAARRGFGLGTDGIWRIGEETEDLWCGCHECSSRFDKEKEEVVEERGQDAHSIYRHNVDASVAEIRRVRAAIRRSHLRELVEMRIRAEPWTGATLRHVDLRRYEFMEALEPVSRPSLVACSRESLNRPDVRRFRERVGERYAPPDGVSVLLLVPCSARKPYSRSRTHRAIAEAVDNCGNPCTVHEVVVTSPLGIVPMDLELFYPASVYDITVSGDWEEYEISMIRRGLGNLLKRHRYDTIVSYLPHMPFVEDIEGMERAVHIKPHDPRDRAGLERLASALRGAVPADKVSRKARNVADARAFARFQFGTDMAELIDDVRYGGSGPQLFAKGERTGTIVLSRGMISLTLSGGSILASKRVHRVMIEDFVPKGSVFAVGVEDCDPMVRPGDEVVVAHKDEVRAVGVARMAASAITSMKRGIAVDVRHVKKR